MTSSETFFKNELWKSFWEVQWRCKKIFKKGPWTGPWSNPKKIFGHCWRQKLKKLPKSHLISVLAHFHTYGIALIIAAWIGFNKGLRTVFMALCIPSHVSLDRLPSATGLHLLFSGLFYIFMGPVVGKYLVNLINLIYVHKHPSQVSYAITQTTQ